MGSDHEQEPDLDGLTRDQLADVSAPAAAVAGVLSSDHGVGLFLDLLAARGFRVEPIVVPGFAGVLPASVD